MKATVASLLVIGGSLALAAWLVHGPSSAQADEMPAKYRDTVRRGLEFLAKNQLPDGHWEGDAGKHPVALTGMAGLALLMEKDRSRSRGGKSAPYEETPHSADVRKAADWLMAQSLAPRDGLLFSGHPSESSRYMQGHGLATLFLAGAFEVETDNVRRTKLAGVLAQAVRYIVRAQSSEGGWYDTSKAEGHDFATISATAIQIHALMAAENVGIPVPEEALHDGLEYLKSAMRKQEKRSDAGETRIRPINALDAAAVLSCRRLLKESKADDEAETRWLKVCRSEIPVGPGIQFGRDELAHYFFGQSEFYRDGHVWSAYSTATFDRLRTGQKDDGSWPASDGICVGSVYSTAIWCTILQLGSNRHPSTRSQFVLSK